MSTIENFSDQLTLLRSFPSTSASHLIRDFYVQENAFDIAAASHWVSNVQCIPDNELEIYGIIENFGVSHQLVSGELHLLGGWRRFVEILPFFLDLSTTSEGSNGGISSSPSSAILLDLARTTLEVLHHNIQDVEVAQCEISQEFLRDETGKMAADLTGLLLFFVDLGGRSNAENDKLFALDSLLDTLSLLTKTSESLFTILLSRSSNEVPSREQIQV